MRSEIQDSIRAPPSSALLPATDPFRVEASPGMWAPSGKVWSCFSLNIRAPYWPHGLSGTPPEPMAMSQMATNRALVKSSALRREQGVIWEGAYIMVQ